MNIFACVANPSWWIKTYVMSCFLTQKVFESERVLIVGPSRSLRAAINKTCRWLVTTNTILNNLGIVPQEVCIVLSLEGWLIDWRIGLFQLRVWLSLMRIVHILCVVICNLDARSTYDIRQLEWIILIHTLVCLCVFRSAVVELVSWSLRSHLARVPSVSSPDCRCVCLLNCLIFALVSTPVLWACVCKLVSISLESIEAWQIKRLHQLLSEGWLSLLSYCILEGYDSIVTHLDLHVCLLVWIHEARHARVLACLAMWRETTHDAHLYDFLQFLLSMLPH